jgi:UDP-N-acetylglucosamine--N-acetylmuramyl-(pentapeptide) pyrophosphoryl-undecaprenol N-acetylglucosamine transferase
MKILMTGAHLTPALAMIDFIQANHPKDQLLFLGRLYSQEKLKQKAVEELEVSKRGVKFIPFQAVKFVNSSFLDLVLAIFTFPKTVNKAKKILAEEKPDVLLSFGSYLAVPFVLAAKSLRIPVVTHEQTIAMGKANQFIANVANKVAISFPQTSQYLKKDNYYLTGNPVRQAIFEKNLKKPAYLSKTSKKILLVMGGNQGSFVINNLIKLVLKDLVKEFTIIHQCGRPNQLKNYPAELIKIKAKLPKNMQNQYFIREWMEEEELFWFYQHADFVISRAGANTILELCVAALPAILIPLPNTHNNEQMLNAQMMQRVGGAIIIKQKNLTASNLLTAVAEMKKNSQEMQNNLKKRKFHQQAAKKIYQLLIDVCQQN